MIILNNVSKSYGDKVLFKNINLSIYNGERVGIVGINGSGKSTFMNLISKTTQPDSGDIKILGSIAYVKQIAENINVDNFSNEDFINFLKTNNELNLNNKLNQQFNTLSGGEQTKLMISFALSKKTDYLLLDEPTNNLDQKGIEWLIDKLNKFNGTVISVSHDRYFLDKFANKILEFENGLISEYYGNYSDYKKQKHEKLSYEKRVYEENFKRIKK